MTAIAMSSTCQNIQSEYDSLKTLKEAFALVYASAMRSGDFVQAKVLKVELEKAKETLMEKLLRPLYYPRELQSIVKKEKYEVKEILRGHTASISTLQALSDGRIVSGSSDNTIRIWQKDDADIWQSEELKGHTDSISTLQALPDGRIVSGSYDHTIRIWQKDDANIWQSEELKGHTGPILTLQALPDGRIMSGSYDSTIRIWDGIKVE